MGELRRGRAAAVLCAVVSFVLSALAIGVGLGLAAPAHADNGSLRIDVPGDGRGYVHRSTVPILRDLDLAPGYSTSGTFTVLNDSAYDVALDLRATEVVQSENECLHQETEAGDTTCTGSDGELRDWLQVTLSRVTGTGDEELWAGSFDELGSGLELAPRLAARAVSELRITVTLPRAAGNETMTDTVSFGLRLGADAGAGVSGATVAVASAPGQDDGVDVEPLLLAAELVLLLGVGILAARRRHHRVAVQVG